MIVGFTGTRNGMKPEQRRTVVQLLQELGATRGVHGDCVGADAHFDAVCKELDIPCGIRPCTFEGLRAWCESEVLAEPKPPMARNRDIVADADVLVACPPNYKRIKSGSGTWATISFGERKGIPVYIVWPNGEQAVSTKKLKVKKYR
jgi:hypothetical protein